VIRMTTWSRSVGKTALAVALFCSAILSDSAFSANTNFDEGLRAYQRGAFEEAAAKWEKAVTEYQRQKNVPAEIKAMMELAAAYQALGQQRHALEILDEAVDLADKSGERKFRILAKSRLGGALVLMSKFEQAEALLRESLESARAENDSSITAAILNELGNLLAAQQKYREAQDVFRECAQLSSKGDHLLAAQALCNSAGTAVRAGTSERAEGPNGEALKAIEGLPTSHDKAVLLITSAQTDRSIQTTNAEVSSRLALRARESLLSALKIAEEMGDRRAATYALGYLGQLYGDDKQLDAALTFSRRAAFAAQEADMPEALYHWEWQSGWLLKEQGKPEEAIAAYRRAVQTVQPIRHDITLGYGNATAHASFRDSQGPMFFELADLLFAEADKAKEPEQAQKLLREARDTVEQLKAVELEDYFHDDCVNVIRAKTRALEKVDERTAIIYVIPFEDRTELLVGLASEMKRFKVPASAEKLTAEVRQFRRNLETRSTYAYLEQAQELHDWLIKPIHQLLTERRIDTLVFVPDRALRTIPFSALYDGKQFLIQEFAVAVAPGLSLVEPRPLEEKKARLLLGGLSEAVQGFPPLDFVPGELKSIEPLYRSRTLLNQDFVLPALREKLTEEQY
jgi:tetratricopeptide (TPR) repeat protein